MTFIQSLLDKRKIQRFNVYRYATRLTAERTSAEPQLQRVSSDAAGGQVGMTLRDHPPRIQLTEPLIRSIFDEAEDESPTSAPEERAELLCLLH
jgi:hypothetical protein